MRLKHRWLLALYRQCQQPAKPGDSCSFFVTRSVDYGLQIVFPLQLGLSGGPSAWTTAGITNVLKRITAAAMVSTRRFISFSFFWGIAGRYWHVAAGKTHVCFSSQMFGIRNK